MCFKVDSLVLRRQVLQLYRDVLRTARLFRGQNDARGADFCVQISKSARDEIEGARTLSNREEIMRRIIGGNEALREIQEKVG